MPTFLGESARTRHVVLGTLPCVSILNQDANVAKIATLRVGQPRKKSKKSGVQGSVALLKESFHLGCVSQDSHQSKCNPRKEGQLGSNHTVKFSKGTWHHKKNSGNKGSIARRHSKV